MPQTQMAEHPFAASILISTDPLVGTHLHTDLFSSVIWLDSDWKTFVMPYFIKYSIYLPLSNIHRRHWCCCFLCVGHFNHNPLSYPIFLDPMNTLWHQLNLWLPAYLHMNDSIVTWYQRSLTLLQSFIFSLDICRYTKYPKIYCWLIKIHLPVMQTGGWIALKGGDKMQHLT